MFVTESHLLLLETEREAIRFVRTSAPGKQFPDYVGPLSLIVFKEARQNGGYLLKSRAMELMLAGIRAL